MLPWQITEINSIGVFNILFLLTFILNYFYCFSFLFRLTLTTLRLVMGSAYLLPFIIKLFILQFTMWKCNITGYQVSIYYLISSFKSIPSWGSSHLSSPVLNSWSCSSQCCYNVRLHRLTSFHSPSIILTQGTWCSVNLAQIKFCNLHSGFEINSTNICIPVTKKRVWIQRKKAIKWKLTITLKVVVILFIGNFDHGHFFSLFIPFFPSLLLCLL